MLECRGYPNKKEYYDCRLCPPKPCPPKPCPPYHPCCVCPARPFLSSYIEATGYAQNIGNGENVVFDIDQEALDIAGTDIELDASGAVFTIKRPGLYHVEWSVNLESGNHPVLLCLMENGEPSSALSNANSSGNYSSGALINVSDVPFTVSLHNFGAPILISEPSGFLNTACSIRILRFADGPN